MEPAKKKSIQWSAIKQVAVSPKGLALCFFILLVLTNSFKTAVFNYLIVSSGAFPSPANLVPGFLHKLAVVTVFFVVLLRLPSRIPAIVLYIVQTVYITVNVMYYFSFQGYLYISQYIGLFSEAFDLITHSALPWDFRSLFMLIDLPFFAGVLVLYPQFREMNRRFLFKPVFYAFSVLFIIYFYRWEVPRVSPIKQMNNRYESDVAVVKKYGLLTFNILDLINLKNNRSRIERFNYGPAFASRPDSARTPLNVLLLQIESLDAYIISQKHKKACVTPYLHSLAGRCVFFPYMLSYHLAGSTSDCEFSTLNSVEPLDDYPSIKLRNYDYPNSLLKRFVRNRYAVFSFHGNRGTYFNRSAAFKKMGFQKFYDLFAMKIPEAGWGATDESVLNYVLGRLKGQKQPFLYHVITMSSHEPFTLIRPYYRNKAYDGIRDGATRNLFNSMSYVDQLLKKFIPAVQSQCPNTIIFIYGDHTPSLPKCSYKKSIFRENERAFEFVPLFVITPDKTVYREKALAASFLDIAPTVLVASGIGDSIRTYGIDLLSLPVQNKDIPFRRGICSRKSLFEKISRNKH